MHRAFGGGEKSVSRTSIIKSHDMVTELCHGVHGRGGSQCESCSLVSSNIFFQLFHGSTHQFTSLLSVGLKYFPHLFEHTRVFIESLFKIAATQALWHHMCQLRLICNSHTRANNGRTKAIPFGRGLHPVGIATSRGILPR